MVWKFDLNDSKTSSSSVKTSIEKPFGFDTDFTIGDAEETAVSADAEQAAKQRAVMGLAYSPAKGLLTTGFMLYMSGTSIQIFSIMTTGMALVNPLKAIASGSFKVPLLLQHLREHLSKKKTSTLIIKLPLLCFHSFCIHS